MIGIRAEAGQYAVQYRLNEEKLARAEAETKLSHRNSLIIIFVIVFCFLTAFLVLVLWQRD